MNQKDQSNPPEEGRSSVVERFRSVLDSPQAAVPPMQLEPETPETPAAPPAAPVYRPNRFLSALWTIGSSLSIILNIILLILLVLMGRQLFTLKQMVGDHLLGGLYVNFVKMDQASIKTSIEVTDTIPVQFPLPVEDETEVVLTQDTRINGARVSLQTGGLNIVNAPTSIVLPAGTRLPIRLDIVVGVDTTVPINLTVPVDIPLKETELHEPFIGLQDVVSPYYWMLNPDVQRWQDIPACQTLTFICQWFFE